MFYLVLHADKWGAITKGVEVRMSVSTGAWRAPVEQATLHPIDFHLAVLLHGGWGVKCLHCCPLCVTPCSHSHRTTPALIHPLNQDTACISVCLK